MRVPAPGLLLLLHLQLVAALVLVLVVCLQLPQSLTCSAADTP